MAEVFNHIRGEANHLTVDAKSASTVVVQRGDLVATNSSSQAYPAASQAWNTSLATTQEDFHDVFAGVAVDRSRNGDTAPILLATQGVFLFKCASATFQIGDLVGPAKDTGNALLSDTVVAVATPNLAVGRVTKGGTSVTTVEVEIRSTRVYGGPQAMA